MDKMEEQREPIKKEVRFADKKILAEDDQENQEAGKGAEEMVIKFETMDPDEDDMSMLSCSIGKAWDEGTSTLPQETKTQSIGELADQTGHGEKQQIKQDKYVDRPDIKVLESGMEDRESIEDNSLE